MLPNIVKLTILLILDFGDVIYKIASNTLLNKLDAVYHSDWNELQKSLKLETHISLTSFKHQLSEQLTDHCTCT